MAKMTTLTAIIDGDRTVGLYAIIHGSAVEQPWPDDWPEVVDIEFLKRHCAQVVKA